MNPESSQEWIKILFAYGPLGVMVVALMYGIWRAAYWIAEKVVLPAMTGHLELIKSMKTAAEGSAEGIIKIEGHVGEIKRHIVVGVAANKKLADSVETVIKGDSAKLDKLRPQEGTA